jgi:hypothetical protein
VHCDVGSGNKARGLLFGLFIPKENEHGVSELATMVHMGYDEIPHGIWTAFHAWVPVVHHRSR